MESLGTVGIADKGEYNPESTYYKGNFVLHEGSSWLALKDNLVGVQPEEGENWKYLARGYAAELLSLITAIDSQGLLGDKGAEVASQSLVDKLSDMVANQIVKKAMMSGVQVNDANMVPTSALAYSMQQAITKNAEGISRLDSEALISSEGPDKNRVSSIRMVDADKEKPYIALYLDNSSTRYGFFYVTRD